MPLTANGRPSPSKGVPLLSRPAFPPTSLPSLPEDAEVCTLYVYCPERVAATHLETEGAESLVMSFVAGQFYSGAGQKRCWHVLQVLPDSADGLDAHLQHRSHPLLRSSFRPAQQPQSNNHPRCIFRARLPSRSSASAIFGESSGAALLLR
ncbi:hypothetical protein VTK73DRAFT_3783 [Phialemonium thermophilum]|uniref:Uncharacterized protein n=1 Tax=Phialemonium thermophilum TaxID=223376 RepID=A0ABR3VGV3_9PEZI